MKPAPGWKELTYWIAYGVTTFGMVGTLIGTIATAAVA